LVTALPDVHIVDEGSTARLVLTGEIDVSIAAKLMSHAERLVGSAPKSIVVDLSGTTFLDSSGVGALVSLSNAANAAGISPVRMKPGPPNVMRVLEIVGLQDVFDVIP
jgi:anti-anti-sigma factor